MKKAPEGAFFIAAYGAAASAQHFYFDL